MLSTELTELAHQIQTELADTCYRRRTHGHHKTYEAGCRGPLCSLANSQRAHRAYVRRHGELRRPTSRTARREAALALVAEHMTRDDADGRTA
jgi:hypothetical protein